MTANAATAPEESILFGDIPLAHRWELSKYEHGLTFKQAVGGFWRMLLGINRFFMRETEAFYQFADAAGYRARQYAERQYAISNPQGYRYYKYKQQKFAANWRGNEGIKATTTASAIGLATAANMYAHPHIAQTMQSLASAARLSAVAGVKLATAMSMANAAAFLSAFVIPATLIAVTGFSLYMAYKALKNREMSFANKTTAFGAAALALTSAVPGLDIFLPVVSKTFSAFMLARNARTLVGNKGQWWSQASAWQKVLMVGGMAASASIAIPAGLDIAAKFGYTPHSLLAKTGLLPVDAPSASVPLSPVTQPLPHEAAVASVAPATPDITSAGPCADWSGFRLSSPFGHRFSAGWVNPHPGLDLAAPIGTPIHNVIPGEVVFAGRHAGYGNMVAVEFHTPQGDFIQKYAHMSRINVHVGEQVDSNCVLGKVGMTGYTDGPHAHYEIDNSIGAGRHMFGRPVNPWNFTAVREAFRNVRLPRGYHPYMRGPAMV